MPIIVKNTTYPNLADLLFPHSCRGCGRLGEVLCECCKNNILAHRQNQKLRPPFYVVDSRNSLLGELIHDYKYHSIRALAKPLAKLLDETLPNDFPKNSIIVPLPTATHHIRNRGLDHTLKIAKHLAKIRHYRVEKLLLRNQNTVQVGSTRDERLTQAKNAYTLNPKIKIQKDATYILLDDVYTTGASITAAKKLLENNEARHIKVALLAYSS
ncbi:ComF family protein [Candidatus Saccharibacteria bacterium]|nr:ComF family protein [Candidatus Saccharibacteria bacterium]